MMTIEPDIDEVAGVSEPRPRTVPMLPGSTPSTWIGVYVVGAVIGLSLLRHSLRRFG